VYNSRIGLFAHLGIALHTGRTHQIRVHLSSMGNPIVGDPIYSKKWEKYKVPFLLLAATHLALSHPLSGKPLEFAIPLPAHFEDFIKKLERIQ
jgi:23S rRNA pseudouridine1911/1915/1917 synthase